jgi:histidinol-phosphate aminotransferase
LSVFDRLVPDHVLNLKTYQAGRSAHEVAREFGLTRVVKLASNENPWGPSRRATAAVREVLDQANRYPDPAALELRGALARKYGLSNDNIIIGNGSEGIIAGITRAFLQSGDEVVTSEGAFQGFTVLCRSRGFEPIQVPLADYRFDLGGIAKEINASTKLIYLCNPNNPTGTFFVRAEFERFMAQVPARVLVILDEAYFEFGSRLAGFPDSMDYRHDNVITLRTFSKAYGLAGYRVGYGFGHPVLIANLWKVKLPFEPGLLAQVAALAALADDEFLDLTLLANQEGLLFFYAELARLGLDYLPSSTNFVAFFVPAPWSGRELYEAMLRRGVIVRPLDHSGLPECLRISVGTPEENQLCVAALGATLQSS